jgi:hypothetical protein
MSYTALEYSDSSYLSYFPLNLLTRRPISIGTVLATPETTPTK